MKTPKMVSLLGELEEELVAEAIKDVPSVQKRRKKKIWIRSAVAACLLLCLGIGAIFAAAPWDRRVVLIDGIQRVYRKNDSIIPFGIMLPPWEEQLLFDRYHAVDFQGNIYISQVRTIDPALVESELGSCTLTYTDLSQALHTESATAYKVKKLSEDTLIAVPMEGFYIAFTKKPPQTLGQFSEKLALEETVTIRSFSFRDRSSHYALSDYTELWQMLKQSGDAPLLPSGELPQKEQPALSFLLEAEAFGRSSAKEKQTISVYESGYLEIDLLSEVCLYRIGTEAAEEILSYLRMHRLLQAYPNPEFAISTLSGTVVGIEDGYLLIDDSVLCADAEEGMVFRISLNSVRCLRNMTYQEIQPGNTVTVTLQGQIRLADKTVQNSTLDISRCDLPSPFSFSRWWKRTVGKVKQKLFGTQVITTEATKAKEDPT